MTQNLNANAAPASSAAPMAQGPDATPLAAMANPVPVSSPSKVLQIRYAEQIKSIAGCPPPDVQALDTVGYRFAFDDVANEHNFLPVAVIQPERSHAGQSISQCCTGYSLSIFDSVENLAKRARKVLKTSPKFLERVGDHFIAMKIAAGDGFCTAPNGSGHFDFFEAASFSGPGSVIDHEGLPL